MRDVRYLCGCHHSHSVLLFFKLISHVNIHRSPGYICFNPKYIHMNLLMPDCTLSMTQTPYTLYTTLIKPWVLAIHLNKAEGSTGNSQLACSLIKIAHYIHFLLTPPQIPNTNLNQTLDLSGPNQINSWSIADNDERKCGTHGWQSLTRSWSVVVGDKPRM